MAKKTAKEAEQAKKAERNKSEKKPKQVKTAEEPAEQEPTFDLTMTDLLRMVKVKCDAIDDCSACDCYDGRICRIVVARPCGWMF